MAGSIPAPAFAVSSGLASAGWPASGAAAMAEDLTDTITQNAQGPESAEVDGVKVKQHSLPNQVAADKYLAQKQAGRSPAKALTRVKIVPPGTV
jgi:hypothetical protein